VRKLKKELKTEDLSRLDSAIQQLEHKIQSSKVPLEAKVTQELMGYRSQRQMLIQYQAATKALEPVKDQVDPLQKLNQRKNRCK